MYSEYVGEDFRTHIGLPSDYKVKAVLAYGAWDLYVEDRQVPQLRKALALSGIKAYQLSKISKPILGHCYELLIEDDLYWFVPVMGTAVMSSYLHIAGMLGAEKFIFLGTCGGLGDSVKAAEMILPLEVKGNDNAAWYHKTKKGLHKPDDTLVKQLRSISIDYSGTTLHEGKTVTREMMYAESRKDVSQWNKDKYLAVEMEVALVYAMAKYFSIPAVGLLYVEDNLIQGASLMADDHDAVAALCESSRLRQYMIGLSLLF